MENVDLITADTQEMQVTHRNGTHLKFGAAPPIVGTMIALSLLAATLEYESRLLRRFSLSTQTRMVL